MLIGEIWPARAKISKIFCCPSLRRTYYGGIRRCRLKDAKALLDAMALHVLAYNLKRVMNILGIRPLIAAMLAG